MFTTFLYAIFQNLVYGLDLAVGLWMCNGSVARFDPVHHIKVLDSFAVELGAIIHYP